MKYRKKPVVVEAHQLPPLETPPTKELMDFLSQIPLATSERDGTLAIETLEGTMIAEPGDWIIRGTRGEFYPCKPKPFSDTFEAAEPPNTERPFKPQTLDNWTHPEHIEFCKKAFEGGDATAEIIYIAAALLGLAEDTANYASDEEADGFGLTAETTRQRADAYRQSYEALLNIWTDGEQEYNRKERE